MKAIVLAVLPVLLLAGCANPGIVKISPDTYLITKTDRAGIFGNASRMKVAAIQEANEFAAEQGKVAIPISTQETPVAPGRFASIEYQFRVVSEDDPEYGRVALTPRADVVTESKVEVDIDVDSEKSDQSDILDRLVRLDDLRVRGILTQEEFEVQKKKLLETSGGT